MREGEENDSSCWMDKHRRTPVYLVVFGSGQVVEGHRRAWNLQVLSFYLKNKKWGQENREREKRRRLLSHDG